MNNALNIAVISEFAGDTFDGVVSSVCTEVARRYPSARVVFVAGFLQRYRPGGFRLLRLMNYLVVYAKSLACYVRHHPDVILVDTTPPFIQLWAAFWGRIFRCKVYVWLMDYHPEIEARYCERIRGLRWLAKAFRIMDAALLKHVSGVITLDTAMADIVRARSPSIEVKVHPVWSKQGVGQYEPIALNRDTSELRLTYVGNLGAAHGLADFERLLTTIKPLRALQLLIVGGSAAGLCRWQEMAHRFGVEIMHTDRLSWNELRERLNKFRPNYGVVLMDDGKRGLLSPSKYGTYMQLGLPILYLGPRGTNADTVCRKTGAGLAATHDEIDHNLEAPVRELLDLSVQAKCQVATLIAYNTLGKLNQVSFVGLLDPWIMRAIETKAL